MTRIVKPFPDYSFLAKAAAEAREASRNYWAKGGYADTKWPRQKTKGWYIPLVDDPDAKIKAAIWRMKNNKERE